MRTERSGAIALAAERLNANLAAIPTVLSDLEPLLVEYHGRVVNGKGRRRPVADLLVARDLRRTVFVAVGHRFAMALLPQAIAMLGTDSAPAFVADSVSIVGSRERAFRGETARLVGTVRGCLAVARRRMYQEWTDAERRVATEQVRHLSLAVRQRARETLAAEYDQIDFDLALREQPYRTVARNNLPFRVRTLLFLAEHLDVQLDAVLSNSELGQAEHLAVGLADLDRTLTAAGCPAHYRPAVVLRQLPLLASLAALREEMAVRTVFDRPHAPLYRVKGSLRPEDWRIVPLSIIDGARVRPGRCPAVVTLPPVRLEHGKLSQAYRSMVARLTKTERSGLDINAAEASTALSVGVWDWLSRHHTP
jgi:hypothetical protein